MQEVGFPDITTSNQDIVPESTSRSPEGNEHEPIKISKEEAANRLREAKGIIGENLKNGAFDKDPQKKDQAQTAVNYTGTDQPSDQETTKGIKAMVGSLEELRAIDPRAKQSYSDFLKYITVQSSEGSNVELYSLQGWKKKLEAIQNDTSLSEAARNHKIEVLEGEARYGFLLQKEQAQLEEQQKSEEDILIAKYRKSFEENFKQVETRDDVSLQQKEKIEETLIMLRLAEEAKGHAGVIFKHLALKNLKDEHGAQGLDKVIGDLQEKMPEAIGKVSELITDKAKAEEFRQAIEEGKLGDMIKEGKLLKIEGMRELLFGQDITEEKLKEILSLNKKKKWKDSLLLALIILALGPVEFAKETIPLKA